jgi:nucleoid-associated protein YgaU
VATLNASDRTLKVVLGIVLLAAALWIIFTVFMTVESFSSDSTVVANPAPPTASSPPPATTITVFPPIVATPPSSTKADLPPAPPPEQKAPPRTYVVVKGDTLWDLSQRFYGHHRYQGLAEANKISNPGLIYPGQRLVIE